MGGKNLTNKPLPKDPKIFPPSPTWMSWVREFKFKRDPVTGFYMKDKNGHYVYDDEVEGKVRYHFDHMDARKSLMWLGRESRYRNAGESGTFYNDWAVYEWVGDEWVLRGEGFKGEFRKDNEFFDLKKVKDRSHPFDRAKETHERNVEEEAIASILQSLKKE